MILHPFPIMVKVALKALLLFNTLMTLVAMMIGFEEEEYEDEGNQLLNVAAKSLDDGIHALEYLVKLEGRSL